MATAVKKRASRVYSPEEERVRAAVESHLPPIKDVVRSYDVRFGEDQAGTPSVFITLRIPQPGDASPKRVDRILHFWRLVSEDLLKKDAGHFPYMEISAASGR
jgi:hypothetical protein